MFACARSQEYDASIGLRPPEGEAARGRFDRRPAPSPADAPALNGSVIE
jgi:hypothetical protein